MATTHARAANAANALGADAAARRDPSSSGRTAPAEPRPDASILVRFERAELAGAACALGDLVRELGRTHASHPGDELVALLDAYHRHLCSAYRACPADGVAPVLAFSSFARTRRRRAGRPERP